MKASRYLWWFLVTHMVGTWTYVGGKVVFSRHERGVGRVRPIVEPILTGLFLLHVWQGTRTALRLQLNNRLVSGAVLGMFVAYHLQSLRFRTEGDLYSTTRQELTQHWYLYELGLLALASHLSRPWIPVGMALGPIIGTVWR
jgi:hypothetical protein